MANAPLSASPTTTTTTPSSAWNRLVQLTRTASEGSRTKSAGSSRQLQQTSPSGTHASPSVPPAKKHLRAESPASRPQTKCVPPLSPEPNDTQTMSPRKSPNRTPCPLTSKHDCITACACRVEDVDCVASQQRIDKTRSSPPRIGREQPAKIGDLNQDVKPQEEHTGPRPSQTQSIPSPSPFETKCSATSTQLGERQESGSSAHKTETTNELASSGTRSLANLDNDDIGTIVSETRQPSTGPDGLVTAVGLQEGDQNSMNKTPISKRHSSSPASTDESIQLATPSSSPNTKSDTRANVTQVDSAKTHITAPATKTKRRLTLHGSSYERQSSHKKRKTQPKRKDGVQTTLSLAIGSSAGMRECKLCDTVYNPFHPEDVKVHSKRHAVAVREREAEEKAEIRQSSLVD